MDEMDAQTGRVYRELRQAEIELSHLRQKLERFRAQVRAVDADWDRLVVLNGTTLTVEMESRPLPTAAEIANVLTEIRSSSETVDKLKNTLKTLAG